MQNTEHWGPGTEGRKYDNKHPIGVQDGIVGDNENKAFDGAQDGIVGDDGYSAFDGAQIQHIVTQ